MALDRPPRYSHGAINSERQTVAELIAANLWEPHTRRPEQGGWELNLAGRCQTPSYITMRGLPDPLLAGEGKERATTLYCGVWVRCRKCVWCLKRRQALWARRSAVELTRSPRTWFVTLTLSPVNHAKMLAYAISNGRTADTKDATYAARHWAIGREITNYLKRIRKTGGSDGRTVAFRYAVVAEEHTGSRRSRPGIQSVKGMPHYHLFVHEYGDQPLRLSQVLKPDGSVRRDKYGRAYWEGSLSEQWKLGFATIKQVDTSTLGAAANYVAGYLSKDARARVRASVRYGAIPSVEQDGRPLDIGLGVPPLGGTPCRRIGGLIRLPLYTPQPVNLDLPRHRLPLPGRGGSPMGLTSGGEGIRTG